MRTILRAILWPALLLIQTKAAFAGSPYIELGTSLGKMSDVDRYFGLTTTGTTTNMGFCGSFSFYVPFAPNKRMVNFALGIQNRMYFVSSSSPQHDFASLAPNIAARLEIFRFFVGGGYAPITLMSTNGPMSLKPNTGVTSFFVEGGLIWRVVPELQIVLAYAQEYGIVPGGGNQSPSPATEYGLRFRLPLSPNEAGSDASSQFDGFRYPFGIMK